MNCWTSKLFIHRKKRTFTFPSPTLLITGWHQESCLLNNYLRKKRRNKGLLGCESSCLCLFVAIWHWVNFFKKIFYCCSITVVPTFPTLPSSAQSTPSPQSVLTLLSMSMGHLFMFFDWFLPLLSTIIPLLPPLWSLSDHSCVHASGSIVLVCFCSLGSSYRWDHMVFVFHHLVYFT